SLRATWRGCLGTMKVACCVVATACVGARRLRLTLRRNSTGLDGYDGYSDGTPRVLTALLRGGLLAAAQIAGKRRERAVIVAYGGGSRRGRRTTVLVVGGGGLLWWLWSSSLAMMEGLWRGWKLKTMGSKGGSRLDGGLRLLIGIRSLRATWRGCLGTMKVACCVVATACVGARRLRLTLRRNSTGLDGYDGYSDGTPRVPTALLRGKLLVAAQIAGKRRERAVIVAYGGGSRRGRRTTVLVVGGGGLLRWLWSSSPAMME
ncbi:Unknown protein, partial [Striga hermonthica]